MLSRLLSFSPNFENLTLYPSWAFGLSKVFVLIHALSVLFQFADKPLISLTSH